MNIYFFRPGLIIKRHEFDHADDSNYRHHAKYKSRPSTPKIPKYKFTFFGGLVIGSVLTLMWTNFIKRESLTTVHY